MVDYPHPFRPWRAYAETQNITYPDTSGYIRDWFRSKFFRGQQLWDDDINNNFDWFQWWLPAWSHRRRDLKPFKGPPTYLRYLVVDIFDPAHYDTPGTQANYYMYQTNSYAFDLKPFCGVTSYVIADKMLVGFTGTAWKPLARLAEKRFNYEIALFANSPKAGKVAIVHKISERFLLPNNSQASRVRGIQPNGWADIAKNGVVVAQAYKSLYSSGVTNTGNVDVIFEPGDILTVTPIAKLGPTLSISLVGGLL